MSELLEAAEGVIAQFEAIRRHQHELLDHGLEHAARNWDRATLGQSIDFEPLILAVQRAKMPSASSVPAEKDTAQSIKEWQDAINCASVWTSTTMRWAERVIAAGEQLRRLVAKSVPSNDAELIEKEIGWCQAHRGMKPPEFEDGFIAGLQQALRLRAAIAEGSAER